MPDTTLGTNDIWDPQYLCQPRAMPAMDLTAGNHAPWIKIAQEKLAQIEAEKVRQAYEQAAYEQREFQKAAKAAAEEYRRRKIEEEAQRTDWDIL